MSSLSGTCSCGGVATIQVWAFANSRVALSFLLCAVIIYTQQLYCLLSMLRCKTHLSVALRRVYSMDRAFFDSLWSCTEVVTFFLSVLRSPPTQPLSSPSSKPFFVSLSMMSKLSSFRLNPSAPNAYCIAFCTGLTSSNKRTSFRIARATSRSCVCLAATMRGPTSWTTRGTGVVTMCTEICTPRWLSLSLSLFLSLYLSIYLSDIHTLSSARWRRRCLKGLHPRVAFDASERCSVALAPIDKEVTQPAGGLFVLPELFLSFFFSSFSSSSSSSSLFFSFLIFSFSSSSSSLCSF